MPNKILLADDSITIQKVVNLTFTDEGINVVTVGNGELALKKLSEESFDLVLADIFMPGRNGYEVCEYIKSNPQFGDIPVVLLVGAFEPFDKSEATRVRADGHLTKPFESRILIETVKRMLAESAVRKAAAAPAPVDTGAYKGHVVGWDVPTQQVEPQHFEVVEPEPPSYDPYASTAKLPVVGNESAEQGFARVSGGATQAIGSPFDGGASAASISDYTAGSGFMPPTTFDFQEVPETAPPAQPLSGPPDSVSGFSYAQTSGPLPDEASPEAPSPFGYRDIHSTDSPLDLPADLAVVESHTHEAAHVEEVRDPLLETFADTAETTAEIVSEPAPGLEVNEQPEGVSSMNVLPAEDITSAWDPQAQPPAFEMHEETQAEAEAEADAIPAAGEWGTMAYPQEEAPFELPDEPSSGASESAAISSWMPAVEEPVEEAAAPAAVAETEESAVSEFADEAVYEEVVHAEEPAVVAAHEEEAVATVALPGNGSSAEHLEIPHELVDEIVRRTIERMSDDVIREIAWDVVPQLAEQIIRRRLSGNG